VERYLLVMAGVYSNKPFKGATFSSASPRRLCGRHGRSELVLTIIIEIGSLLLRTIMMEKNAENKMIIQAPDFKLLFPPVAKPQPRQCCRSPIMQFANPTIMPSHMQTPP
jgi:hypothetical protein